MSWTQIGSDIDAKAAFDNFGNGVAISGDGTVMAVSATGNDGNGSNSGQVRIFKNVTGTWIQIGSDINGEASGDICGTGIAISGDGTTVAIGATGNDGNGSNSGNIRVFKNISNVWTKIGSNINGEAWLDNTGWDVTLNNDGTVMAVGARFNYGTGYDSGSVRVYKNISNVWIKIGSDIDGTATNNQFGFSVALNSSGTILATSARLNSAGGTNSGYVKIYQNNSDVWTQIGSTIFGEALSDNSGYSVALSSDGTIVAIGAINNDENGTNSGHTRVYQNNSGVWTQIGSDINGEAADDNSGYSVALSSDGTIVAIGAINNDGNGTNSGHVRVYKYQTSPSTPTISSVTISQTTATINFTQSSNGTADVTSYKYATSTNGTTYDLYVTSNWTSETSFTVTNLTIGTTYYFKIIANNGIDSSESTASSAVTVQDFVPNTPTISSVTVSQTTATINFTQSSNGTADVTSYKYAFSTTGSTGAYGSYVTSNWATGTNFTVSGLTVGSTYYFKIIANNEIDSSESTASSAVTVQNFASNTPTISSVTVSQTTATIIFTQLTNGSAAIISYKYAFSTTGSTGTYNSYTTSNWTTGTNFTVSGLTVGTTYYFKIIANNGINSIASSASSAATVVNFAPATPTISSVTVSQATATINFTVGTANGSFTVSSYKYAFSTTGSTGAYGSYVTSNWATGTSFTVSGLTVNTTYYFKIIANNGIDSIASSASSPVTIPDIPPPSPTISSVTLSQATATINFTAGSAAVTSYKYAFSTTGATGTYGSYVTSNWATGTSFTVSGLTVGTTYYFKIIANNGLDSIASTTSSVVTVVNFAPNAPTILNATGSNTTATIIFTPGSANGSNSIINYAYSTDSVITQNSVFTLLSVNSNGTYQTSSPITIAGLSNGQTYSFTLKAFNGLYSSASLTLSNILVSLPKPPPTIQSVSGRDGTATISFNQQTNVSAPITGYAYSMDATITDNSIFTLISRTTSPITITGLTNGQQYSFTLKSFNGSYSRASPTMTTTIYSKPAAPVIFEASGSNKSALFNFTQSSAQPPIDYYLYSINNGTFNPLPLRNGQEQRTSPFYIDNLNSLENYSFRFKSYNDLESATHSDPVSVFIETSQPAPVIQSVVGNGSGEATITITQSLNASGPLQNYYYSTNGTNWILFDPPQTSTTLIVDGLDDVPNYNFTLMSFNGISSENSNTILNVPVNFTAPSPPSITSIEGSGGNIILTFTQQEQDPSISISYVYSTDTNINKIFTNVNISKTSSNKLTISGITSRFITITIRAYNIIYYSSDSNSVTYIIPSVDSATNDTVRIKQTNSSSPIQYSINNGTTWNNIVWPFIVGNNSSSTKNLLVKLESALSLGVLPSGVINFFTIANNNITIDGNNYNITINNFTNFPGLIQNGTLNSNGFNIITVKNIKIIASGTTSLAIGQGWVCESYFGKGTTNNLIENCFSSGQISKNSGGISGQYTAINSTNFSIRSCSASGNIMSNADGSDAGGIIGSNAGGTSSTSFLVDNCTFSGAINGYGSGGIVGSFSRNIKITNCSTTGIITGGGIAGRNTGTVTSVNLGLVEITDCFSSGDIGSIGNTSNTLASFAGGIVADYAETVNITRCYSLGKIGDAGKNSCGGIVGAFAGDNGGGVIIQYCFSVGNIYNSCGGIAAHEFGKNVFRGCGIFDSYSIGDIGENAGGIVGANLGIGSAYIVRINRCYSLGSFSKSTSGGIAAASTCDYTKYNKQTIDIKFCFSMGVPVAPYRSNAIVARGTTLPATQTNTNNNITSVYNTVSSSGSFGSNITTIGNVTTDKADISSTWYNWKSGKPYRLTKGLYIFNPNIKLLVPLNKIIMLGFTISDLLITNGYTLAGIEPFGFSKTDFVNAGYDEPSWLTEAGYSLSSIREAGFTALELMVWVQPPLTDLKNAGYSATIIRDLRYGLNELKFAGFNPEALKGVIGIAQLKLSGFNTRELRLAGYLASDLIQIGGYTYKEFKGSGYLASELTRINFKLALTYVQMLEIGYTNAELSVVINWNVSAGSQIKTFWDKSVPVSDIPKDTNITNISQTQYNVADFIKAGWTRHKISRMGFSVSQLYAAGFSASDLKTALYSNTSMITGGLSSADVNNAITFTNQPAPRITNVISSNKEVLIYFIQPDSNTSADITNYGWSIDGVAFSLCSPAQTNSPLKIDTGDIDVNAKFYIAPYNGEINFPNFVGEALSKPRPKPPKPDGWKITSIIVLSAVVFPVAFYFGSVGIAIDSLGKAINDSIELAQMSDEAFKNAGYKALHPYETNIDFLYSTPEITNITSLNGVATISFNSNKYGTEIIDSYAYSLDGGLTFTLLEPYQNTSPLTISGLRFDGNYSISIRAYNLKKTLYNNLYSRPIIGTNKITNPINLGKYGPLSNILNISMNYTSYAPVITNVRNNNTDVDIEFTQLLNCSGTITNYSYSVDNGINRVYLSPQQARSPLKISGLNLGINNKFFIISAYNGLDSPWSNSFKSVNVTTPSAPIIKKVLVGYEPANRNITQIHFTQPATTGITNYEITVDGGVNWIPLGYNSYFNGWEIFSSIKQQVSPLRFIDYNFADNARKEALEANGYGSYAYERNYGIRAVTTIPGNNSNIVQKDYGIVKPAAPTITTVKTNVYDPTTESNITEIYFTQPTNTSDAIANYEITVDNGVNWIPLSKDFDSWDYFSPNKQKSSPLKFTDYKMEGNSTFIRNYGIRAVTFTNIVGNDSNIVRKGFGT